MSGRGKAWEARLDVWHAEARRAGTATLMRCNPGVKITGRGELVFAEKGPPDYLGHAGGHPVVFDAKETRAKVLYFSQVKEHQARDLEALMLGGFESAIVARVAGVQRWLPWAGIREAYYAKLPTAPLDVGFEFGDEGWIPGFLKMMEKKS